MFVTTVGNKMQRIIAHHQLIGFSHALCFICFNFFYLNMYMYTDSYQIRMIMVQWEGIDDNSLCALLPKIRKCKIISGAANLLKFFCAKLASSILDNRRCNTVL